MTVTAVPAVVLVLVVKINTVLHKDTLHKNNNF